MPFLPARETESAGEHPLFAVVCFAVLLALLFFIPHSADFLAKHAAFAARSVLGEESSIAGNILAFRALLSDKESLVSENEDLRRRLSEQTLLSGEFPALKEENESLKELLGRKGSGARVLASVLLRPNRSPYDTLLIDIGSEDGLRGGERVFAYGSVFVGKVEEVYDRTARVLLHSSPGVSFSARIKNADVTVVGEGGGSFETSVPRTLEVSVGDEVVVPSLNRLLLGRVAGIIADARDPIERLLIEAPVPFSNLTEVMVELK